MKITLAEDKTIKGKDYAVGEQAIVNKELGERLISEGIANRIIEEPENRAVLGHARFSGHKVFSSSDGKTHGNVEYVEE